MSDDLRSTVGAVLRLFSSSGRQASQSLNSHRGRTQKNELSMAWRRACLLLLSPLLLLVVLGVRLLRPIVLIRFGGLMSTRIGHFADNTELYLCSRDAEARSRWVIDIFYHVKPICNRQLQKMWERTPGMHIIQSASVVSRLNRLLPGSEPHTIDLTPSRDIQGVLHRFPPHLSFTDEEERVGRAAIRKMGVPEGAQFICFHARDSAYLDTLATKEDPNTWDYQDYRDCDIRNYIPAIEALALRGHYLIRMGSVVRQAFSTENPRIIDYANNGFRTEFLDIYLGAKCRFFISSGSGIDAIPMIFRRPIAFVNFIPFEHVHSWAPNIISIPKKLWLRTDHRFMAFQEILMSGVGRLCRSEQYQQRSIEPVENSPEEIVAVVLEMEERLNRTWQETEENRELQHRFWSLLNGSDLHGVCHSRIGTEFLRKNKELLG